MKPPEAGFPAQGGKLMKQPEAVEPPEAGFPCSSGKQTD
jgi:hypothetical protein